MSGGDDLLALQLGTAFADTVYLSGGAGTANALVDDGTTEFTVSPTIVRFQQ